MRAFRPLVLLAIILVVALALAEIALRSGLVATPNGRAPSGPFTQQPGGGIALLPGAESSAEGPHDARVIINRYGMRDLDRPRSESAFRILAVGDGFAFGWGVPMETGFLARAEDYLDREAAREVQIIKAAAPGWGPAEELAWLQTHWDEWSPQLLLVAFATGNDFSEMIPGRAPRYRVENGHVVAAAGSEEPRRDGLAARIAGRSLALSALWRRARPAAAPRAAVDARESDVFLKESEIRPAIDATLRALHAMRELARSRDAAFVVVAIADARQIHSDDYVAFRDNGAYRDGDLDMGRPQRELRTWSTRARLALIDLEPALTAFTANKPDRLYFAEDGFWTEQGHRLAGNTLGRYLIDTGLVPREPGATDALARQGRARLSLPRTPR